MVDFVLVSMLVLVAVMALLQLALGLHARNVLIDAAGEGARRAALAGGTPAEARARVRALSDAALADGYVQRVEVSRTRIDGLSVVVVTVTAPLPVLGLLGPGGSLRVQGRAVDELALVEEAQGAAPPGGAAGLGDPDDQPGPVGPVDLEEAARAAGAVGLMPVRRPRLLRIPGRLRPPGRRAAQERGSASVEFIGWSAILLIPTLYLLVTLSQIQAASFAVASAADVASRVLEVDTSPQALAHARTAAGLALSDQGVEDDPAAAVSVSCEGPCTAGAVLRVRAAVDLPGLGAIGLGREVVVLEARRAVDLSAKEGP